MGSNSKPHWLRPERDPVHNRDTSRKPTGSLRPSPVASGAEMPALILRAIGEESKVLRDRHAPSIEPVSGQPASTHPRV